MTWLSVRVTEPELNARDAIVALLIGAGAEGVQDLGAELLTYVPAAFDVEAIRAGVSRVSAGARVDVAPAGNLDASTRWIADVGVQRTGRLTIAPPWLAHEATDPAFAIIIDPAMAFGTGEHPTTRGVLRLLQQEVRAGDFVADLGAGSAILGIAAAKLGATRVAAIELDPDAIGNAEENVARNGVADRVMVIEGDAAMLLPLIAPVRLVLANIISSVLLGLLDTMRAALTADGRVILSGILVEERSGMIDALTRAGWTVIAEDSEGEWWSTTTAPR